MKGGARPGAGRKKGSKNEASKKRAESVKLAAQLVAEFMPNAFPGDSHALLMAVYKNQELPLLVRIDAAKAAIGFEKPRLGSTEVKTDVTHHHGSEPVSATAEWIADTLRARADRKAEESLPN